MPRPPSRARARGRCSRASSSSSCSSSDPEVRLDHGRIRLHLGGRAARDLPPEAQDVDVVGDAHDEVHVVLDEENGELEVVADLLDEGAELGDLLVVQPARGLVEEKEARLGHERARELDALLDPVGQRRCRELRALAESDDVEDLERVRLTGASALGRAPRRARSRARTSSGRAGCSGTSARSPCPRSCSAGALRIDEPSSSTSPESGL